MEKMQRQVLAASGLGRALNTSLALRVPGWGMVQGFRGG